MIFSPQLALFAQPIPAESHAVEETERRKTNGRTDGQTDRRTDRQTDRQRRGEERRGGQTEEGDG